ncbi:MAG: FtsX-like permease family protein [Planctomycetota bacterium]|nr:FtsX-like permease family protein [Planctomycetota bacterium]
MWSEWLSSPGVAEAIVGGALVLAGLAAVVLASPVYKHILCMRYLFAGWKAVVPLVSALPAALGVFLLILVFAIMDGFVRDTREMTRGTLADIIVDAHMEGLPYYDEFIRRIDAIEGVESATPLVQTYAIIRVKPRIQAIKPIVRPCMVIGIRPEQKAKVGRFQQYLVRQPPDAADPASLLAVPPAYRRAGEPVRSGCIAGIGLIGTPWRTVVMEKGYENAGSRVLLCFMAGGAFIIFLFVWQASRRNWGRRLWRVAMVAWALAVAAIAVEAALIPVYEKPMERRQVVDVPLVDYGDDLLISTIPIRPSGAMEREVGGMPKISEKIFALVDVFKSGYWEADSSHLYVDFSVAQQMAGMEGQPASDDKPAVPARASQVQIKVRNPAEAQKIVEKVGGAWREFVRERPEAGLLQLSVNTWETQQRMILTVVEMERNITALMLGLMFVGFAVLIALISYVMAYIKSRDVGILKAVGAHDAGVGSLFLGYGFIIGVIGTVLGLGGALLMIYYLDSLEVWVNATFDVNVFPREMYYFEHIPRHISALWCVVVSGAVLVLATLASMAWGLLAALRQPVETLRYE